MTDKVVLYVDAAGETRWRKFAPNGNKVADSGEGYTNWADGVEAAAREASPPPAEVFVDAASAHIPLEAWQEAGYGKPGDV